MHSYLIFCSSFCVLIWYCSSSTISFATHAHAQCSNGNKRRGQREINWLNRSHAHIMIVYFAFSYVYVQQKHLLLILFSVLNIMLKMFWSSRVHGKVAGTDWCANVCVCVAQRQNRHEWASIVHGEYDAFPCEQKLNEIQFLLLFSSQSHSIWLFIMWLDHAPFSDSVFHLWIKATSWCTYCIFSVGALQNLFRIVLVIVSYQIRANIENEHFDA